MPRQTLCLGIALFLATGCAIGREQAFHTTTLQLQPASQGSRWIALAVYDQRSEILEGKKAPEFVGLSRGGWGNPFDVTTATEGPLADEMATSIAHSLKKAGYRVDVLSVTHKQPPTQVVSKLASTGAPRLLLVRLRRWKSDTYQNTSLDYDVDVTVLDPQGVPLGQKLARGNDNLGGSAWNPGAYADEAVPKAFQQKLEGILNDASIVQALVGQPGSDNHAASSGGVPRS